MARRSLKPQLNQIRSWVQQGRTDAWIAHQLEVTVAELREFRKQHELTPEEQGDGSTEMELRDEIEAEVEAATAEAAVEEPEEAAEAKETKDTEDEGGADAERPSERTGTERPSERTGTERPSERAGTERPNAEAGEEGGRPRRRRRRGRRGGRGRRRELEGTFDHGERDGYGLWLDPSVKDNPVYAENWAGKREISVRIEPDQIVIRRAGTDENGSSAD